MHYWKGWITQHYSISTLLKAEIKGTSQILFKVMWISAADPGRVFPARIGEQCRVNIDICGQLEGYPAPQPHDCLAVSFTGFHTVLRHLFAQFVHQMSLLDSIDFTEWYIDEAKMKLMNRYTFVHARSGKRDC